MGEIGGTFATKPYRAKGGSQEKGQVLTPSR